MWDLWLKITSFGASKFKKKIFKINIKHIYICVYVYIYISKHQNTGNKSKTLKQIIEMVKFYTGFGVGCQGFYF